MRSETECIRPLHRGFSKDARTTNLPRLIENEVGEQMRRLEERLLEDFRLFGERTVEESTAVLSEHLGGRIETLERVSARQSESLLRLRNASRLAEQKVSAAVHGIEQTLADAVPGFELPAGRMGTRVGTEVVKANPREVAEWESGVGFCPACTSTNVRRSNRSGLFEEFLRLVFVAPFRCRACRHKFYRF